MPRRNWTRDETLLAFRLYNLTQYGRIHSGNEDIVKLATIVGRTPSAVAKKMLNLASFDPAHLGRGVVSLQHTSRLDREIWDLFHVRLHDLYWASDVALRRLLHDTPEPDLPGVFDSPQFTGQSEVLREVPVRRAQRFFREVVLTAYNGRCAVSGIDKRELLNASHIIPWRTDPDRRTDPTNGLALSALHDRAFDRGLIAFDEGRAMLVSDRLKSASQNEVVRVGFLELEGKVLEASSRYAPDPGALAYHRERLFVG